MYFVCMYVYALRALFPLLLLVLLVVVAVEGSVVNKRFNSDDVCKAADIHNTPTQH